MRIPIPPAWRALARGGVDNWQLLALVVGGAGAAWALSPYSTVQKVAERREGLVGRTPNQTGRALGYDAGVLASPPADPLEVLIGRAVAARAGTTAPTYRAGRSDYFRPVLASPPDVHWPLGRQNLRGLNAQAPVRGEPMQASPGVSITAADVLAIQRPGASS